MLGRQLAPVTGLSQHKAGAWFHAGEAAGSDTGLSQHKAGAWFHAGEAAGSSYWIKSSVRPRPGIVLGRRLAL